MRVLLDTTVFVAREAGRPLAPIPQVGSISVITLAELSAGVHSARDDATRGRRRRTYDEVVTTYEPHPVDRPVADVFGELVGAARAAGRRVAPMDLLIAATALVHGLPLVTQDAGFDAVDGLTVIRV